MRYATNIFRQQKIMKAVMLSTAFTSFMVISTGCKKLVEVDAPTTSITADNAFASDATAISVLNGIYSKIGFFVGGENSITYSAGLSADEFTLFPGSTNINRLQYYRNALSVQTGILPDFWVRTYSYIYLANAAIEGLTAATGLTPAVRQQLLGEAKFMRAFFYFYLVNLYGDAPIVTSTAYESNASLSRSPAEDVWELIVSDLLEAQDLLSSDYLSGSLLQVSSERVRPTKGAARALLARSYLYAGDWSNAEATASQVIDDNNGQYSLVALNDAFLMNNSEAIWQLQPVSSGWNTYDAFTFVLPPSGPYDNSIYLNNGLVQDFEADDQRRLNWIDSVVVGSDIYYYPFKYKVNMVPSPLSEFPTILRLSEQYLIRAEARARLGNSSGAVDDLNIIRGRAGLADYSGATDETSLLAQLLHERRAELFSEWGHRWLDLKRTGTIDAAMTTATTQKGGTWTSTQQLYPIPSAELSKGINLVQNPGY